MDIERAVRIRLSEFLERDFICRDEVELEVPDQEVRLVRADVVAWPRDPLFADRPIAFEVKRPNETWGYSKWANAIHQATNYVGACPKVHPSGYSPAAISMSAVYPAPPYFPMIDNIPLCDIIQCEDFPIVTGMFHLGPHMRVGGAREQLRSNIQCLSIALGPNELWHSKSGFKKHWMLLRPENKRVGSRTKQKSHEGK